MYWATSGGDHGASPGHPGAHVQSYRADVDDTITASPRVLVIGLDPYRVPGPWDPAPVAEAISQGLTTFADHGVGVEVCLVGVDGSEDVGAVVGRALQSRRVEAPLSWAVACATRTTTWSCWSRWST